MFIIGNVIIVYSVLTTLCVLIAVVAVLDLIHHHTKKPPRN